ncbi:hypothetical protein Nepgr_015322 [Nepenthes gracilis]|uniref:non-specific serine/threonine protein kinase n=1 Tax=Nepenthes gracilis TaxID=150966 RepID=A0AAD3SNF4_NEPGR|nr:hypothetical protein Nepgr_015322 [Nepenthes gracilis]
MGNTCRGSLGTIFSDGYSQPKDHLNSISNSNSKENPSDHSNFDSSPVSLSSQQLVSQKFDPASPKEDHKLPVVSPMMKDSVMRRSTENQAYYVLGHMTPNIRDLYTLGRKLGQGQFGITYLCTEISTRMDYACKSISKRKLISKEDVEDVRREIQIMHHLAGQKNIVAIKGAYEDPLYVHIVMELCSGGELFDRIIQRGHYSERKAAELIKIIVGVVETCHSLGVMHRDLKPENFLLVNKDDDFSLKAIDFGLSVFFKPGQIFTDVVGSPYYVAPEVLLKHYGPEADVWTAGVILYILLSGVPPFWAETQQGIFDAVLKGHIDFESDPWPLISDSAKDLIRRMLCSRPSERLPAHQVLCHPWICKNGVAPDRALDPAVLSRLKQFSAMNKLKKMALRVIAESLSEEEIAGLREMFQSMDTDNSGAITFEELKAGLRRYGSTLKDIEIRDLMEAADVDNDGTIDYGEFIAATIHLNKLEREEHLVAAFRYFDKDASGYITIDELQQACAEHGMSDGFLEDIIREVDQDNDGRIDYEMHLDLIRVIHYYSNCEEVVHQWLMMLLTCILTTRHAQAADHLDSPWDIVDDVSNNAPRRFTGVCVLSSIGEVTNVNLREPAAPTGSMITLCGRFEILSGTALLPPSLPGVDGLTIFLVVGWGQVVGGSLAGPLFSSGPLVLMAASFANAVFDRLPSEEEDQSTVTPVHLPPHPQPSGMTGSSRPSGKEVAASMTMAAAVVAEEVILVIVSWD